MYIHNAKESLALNLEIDKTNCHLTVIANNRESAISLVVTQMVDPTQFRSAIFMFCLENGRWRAAISSSVYVHTKCMPRSILYVNISTCMYTELMIL